jgi:glycosyltransferase involved in cell wall biosynthesis
MGATVSASPPVHERQHVVFLIRSFGFPEGMAATNRVRLLGRALLEQGVDVKVLCTRVSERPGEVRNRQTRGVCERMPYLYTTGSTLRSDWFIVRRYREARGLFTAMSCLRRLRRQGQLDCVYLPEVSETWLPAALPLRYWLGRLRVPVIAELNELPGTATWLPQALSRRLSHLSGVAGVIAISAGLADWATAEAARIGRRIQVVEVPIVVDVHEQEVVSHSQDSLIFVYSASNEYFRVVTFLLQAMQRVWIDHPSCNLTITGVKLETVARLAAQEGLDEAVADGRIVIAGYLDRRELLLLYRRASALLIPLVDDLGSRARFPSKIGEYLASARPVVTTAVGESQRFFLDAETAYVSPPGDLDAYAARMAEVLDDPSHATAVGAAGRHIAEEYLHYALQGPRLASLVEAVAGREHTRYQRNP